MSRDISHEKASGFFVQSGRAAEKTRQKGIERSDWNQAAPILQKEFCREIGIATLNVHPSFIHHEICKDVVVAQTPARAIQPGAHGS